MSLSTLDSTKIMLKSQVSMSSNHLQRSLSSQYNNEGSNSLVKSADDSVNFITFNQDASCVALGLNKGYKIFSCSPSFGKCYQFKKNESIGIVEMLYSTSLIAIVKLGEEPGASPRKLKIVNTKRQSTICDLIFPSTILQVKLTRERMMILLEEQVYIYDTRTMKLLHTIETSPNSSGLCAVSGDGNTCLLAYPSPPKTVTHGSLLVNGVNTNGGPNSIQNNVQSVSNSPNRVGDVIIFNVSILQPLCVIEAHKSSLAALSLSNDGRLLATASDKGTIIRVFSVSTGVKLYQFRRGTYPTKIFSLSFSADDTYVVATSSSETVHIFRLSEEEALETKQRRKRISRKKRKWDYETIEEENEEESRKPSQEREGSEEDEDDEEDDDDEEEIHDDGDDSDADNDNDNDNDNDADQSIEEVDVKQRKLSQGSNTSYASINSDISNFSNDEADNSQSSVNRDPRTEPIVDQNRLSVARLIRRSSQNLGRKAAQKMGDFLPSRFSSILEPTRNFASLKINAVGKDVKSVAVMGKDILTDEVPHSFIANRDKDSTSAPSAPPDGDSTNEPSSLKLLHINVVTSEGFFYTYGLDPDRGGDCILLNQYSLLDEGN